MVPHEYVPLILYPCQSHFPGVLVIMDIQQFNTLRLRQNGHHFTDTIFKCIILYENVWIPIKISLKFVPKGPVNNISSLVQIMAWHRPGDKPLSEPMMVRLLMRICVTRPQWVKELCKMGQLCFPSDVDWKNDLCCDFVDKNIAKWHCHSKITRKQS